MEYILYVVSPAGYSECFRLQMTIGNDDSDSAAGDYDDTVRL